METFFSQVLWVGTGVSLTLKLLVLGGALGLILGVLLAVLRHNKVGTFIIQSFTSLIRGTPLILQLSLIYFSIPLVIGLKLSILGAGILAFGLNSSAYIAEILRAGIESLPKGQFEAAQTLKIPTFYLWKDIILPQVLRNIFPSMINECIALLKETALISTIGGMDIMRTSQALAAEQFTYLLPLCIAGGYYYSFVLFIEFVGRKIEARNAYAARS